MTDKRIEVSFHIQNELWKKKLKPYTKTIRQVLEVAVAETELKNLKQKIEVSVVLADDKFIKNLNHQYSGKNKATNVLSFPSSPATDYRPLTTELGDIVLALETIEKEAKEQQKTFRHHSMHLLVHGFLHLVGYDHMDEKQAEIMEGKEIKILKKLNISNPYI